MKWSDDLFAFQSYSVRFINSWVDFEPFEGVDKVVMLSWQCRTFDDGPIVWGGIQRQDLPETPSHGYYVDVSLGTLTEIDRSGGQ